ncbi:unnamed protein product, partial [Symbiodinium sp. KB8]
SWTGSAVGKRDRPTSSFVQVVKADLQFLLARVSRCRKLPNGDTRMRSRVRTCWNVALTGRVLVDPKEPAAGNKDVAASKKPEAKAASVKDGLMRTWKLLSKRGNPYSIFLDMNAIGDDLRRLATPDLSDPQRADIKLFKVMFFLDMSFGAVMKLPFIEWLKQATREPQEGLQVLQNTASRVGLLPLPWSFSAIVERQCYTKLCEHIQQWDEKTGMRLVLSGTPGIGKTTLLYYLLWKFFHGELDYEVVVLGDVSMLVAILRDGTCRNHETGQQLGMLPKSLGLFDVATDGTVKKGGERLNNQQANADFRVYHMLVVATPGFGSALKEFRKPGAKQLYLPVWGESETKALCTMSKMSDEAIEGRANLCGFAIPRLILNLRRGQRLTAKDAHTMLVLQSSEVLKEDTPLSFACFHKKDNDEGVQGQGESLILAGTKVGFASEFVQTQLFIRMGQSGEQLSNLLRWIPELGRYYFQQRVLNELVGTQGVALSPDRGKESWSLRFERVEAFTCRKMDVSCGVLYRNPPEADRMKSVDGFGWHGDTLYLLQPTIAKQHYEIVGSHLREILATPLPHGITKVVGLYIRPRHTGVFQLRPRGGIQGRFDNKPYSTQVVAVPDLWQSFLQELQKALC